MNLAEFRSEMEQHLESFCSDYHKQRTKGKQASLFRPESEWHELFKTYMENHSVETVR